MYLLSATALLDDGVTLTRTCRQELEMKERQVAKNMHGNVYGLKLRLALKQTFIGRISKGFTDMHFHHLRPSIAHWNSPQPP